MAVLRTARLFAATLNDVGQNVFICPTGYRAVLRSMDLVVWLGETGSQLVSCGLIAGADPEVYFLMKMITAGQNNVEWRGQLVLNAGDIIKIAPGGNPGDLLWATGSGALMPVST